MTVVDVPITILIVDDHAENRASLRAILSDPAYRILEAGSGSEALRILIDQEVALILLDIVMPDMNGLEVADLIRQRERTAAVPIVFMTAHADDKELLFRSYRAGAVDYMTRPLVPEIVRAKTAVFAQLFRQRRQIELQAKKELELGLVQLRLANERRYQSLAEAIPHIVWTSRSDGVVDYFNRRWFEYTGISVERAGGGWGAAIHPDDRGACEDAWRRAVETGEMHETECRLRRLDGEYRWHLCRAVPEEGPAGKIAAWLGSFTDIDDERRARVVLAEFKATLDAVLDAVLIFEPGDGRFLYVNHGACALLGFTADELLGMRPATIIGDYDEAGFGELLAPLVHGEQTTITVETKFRRRNAATVPVEVSLQLVPPDGGNIVSIARDITERIRVRREREVLYHEAVDAVRARDEFLSVASHELRTPITALQLQLDMLLRASRRGQTGPAAAENLKSKLEIAGRQVERLVRLVGALLDVSRLAAKRLRLEREESDLCAIAREVIEHHGAHAANADSAVTLVGNTPVLLRCDRSRIEQVITNLLSNALKFGAGKPIEIAVEQDGPTARLRVSDHGIGIAAEDVDRIFQRYEQAAPSRMYGGLGLGLYIAQGIVRAHGGTLRVDSALGKGATFIVELPREPAHDEQEISELESTLESSGADAHAG